MLLVYVGLIGLTGFGFSRIPTGFIPMQDKGYLVTNIQLPDSASLERTLEVTDKVEKIALETPGVAHTLCLPGMSYVLNANSSNYSNVFIIFKPFHDRREPSLGGDAIAAKIRERLAREVPEARVLVFGAPPISGLGTSAGFKLMVEGIGDVDFDALQARADELAAKGNQQPGLVGLFNGFRARTPQLYVDIDREKAKSMGVALTDVFDTLQACVGSYYVNDFNRFGRTWQVNVQADAPFRMDAETIQTVQGAQRRRRHGAAGSGGRGARLRRAGPDHPLQHVPDGLDQRAPAARDQHGRRPGEHGAAEPRPAAQHDHRVDRGELPAEAGEQARAVPGPAEQPLQCLRGGGGARLLRAGRPVRELVAAVVGDPRRADVPAERVGGPRPGRV